VRKTCQIGYHRDRRHPDRYRSGSGQHPPVTSWHRRVDDRVHSAADLSKRDARA
jgi:hypothetical protein